MAYIVGQMSEDEITRLRGLGHEVRSLQVKELQIPGDTDPCPYCQGRLCRVNDDEVVCDDCDAIWVTTTPMSMVYVDADAFKLLDPWRDDRLQFARLISEINACVEIRAGDMDALLESMDLEDDELQQLFDRADRVWEASKPPPGGKNLDEEIAALLFRDGLGDAEVVKNLYGVEPHDLVGVIRGLMSQDVVFCHSCGRRVPDPGTVHFDDDNKPICLGCRG